jgi:DNA-binding transcriptional MocR family regulator
MDGFTPAVRQMAMSLFMDEGYFSSHLRRMRALYGAKRAMLIEGLTAFAARGWTRSGNPAGMHLLAAHEKGRLHSNRCRVQWARSCAAPLLLRRTDAG